MRRDEEYAAQWPDRTLWRKSQTAETVEDEADRFLDLASLAEGRLDADEAERVRDWITRDPDAAADVAAARSAETAAAIDAPEPIIARACALVTGDAAPGKGAQTGVVIAFPQRRPIRQVYGMARWGSLVAAMALAGWLGFTLGMDTSQSLSGNQSGDEGFAHELLDPSTGFLHDLTGGTQT